jgi:hypothetical protein
VGTTAAGPVRTRSAGYRPVRMKPSLICALSSTPTHSCAWLPHAFVSTKRIRVDRPDTLTTTPEERLYV